jgi:hypothetical protein
MSEEPTTPIARFFSLRRSGRVPWQTLLWRDMLGVGTLINLTATLLALVAAIHGAHTALVALLHFAPLPYNLFLLAALRRSPQRPAFAGALAGTWFVTMLVL